MSEGLVERAAKQWEAMKRPGGYVDRDDLIRAVIEEMADAVEETATEAPLANTVGGSWLLCADWLREQAREDR